LETSALRTRVEFRECELKQRSATATVPRSSRDVSTIAR
jgi:hypothetical protein